MNGAQLLRIAAVMMTGAPGGGTSRLSLVSSVSQGSRFPRCPKARQLHPTDEDLSVGAPDLGQPIRDLKVRDDWRFPS